jgi:hypothetical protein
MAESMHMARYSPKVAALTGCIALGTLLLGAAAFVVVRDAGPIRAMQMPTTAILLRFDDVTSTDEGRDVIEDYGLTLLQSAPIGWMAVTTPFESPTSTVELLRRDPRVADASTDSTAPPDPDQTATYSEAAPSNEQWSDFLHRLLGSPSGCSSEAEIAAPLWPAWDDRLLAVEIPGANCDASGRVALLIETGRASNEYALAAVTHGMIPDWLPPVPPDRIEGKRVSRRALVWGLLDGPMSGPLNPMWLITIENTDYLVFGDGSLAFAEEVLGAPASW